MMFRVWLVCRIVHDTSAHNFIIAMILNLYYFLIIIIWKKEPFARKGNGVLNNNKYTYISEYVYVVMDDGYYPLVSEFCNNILVGLAKEQKNSSIYDH